MSPASYRAAPPRVAELTIHARLPRSHPPPPSTPDTSHPRTTHPRTPLRRPTPPRRERGLLHRGDAGGGASAGARGAAPVRRERGPYLHFPQIRASHLC